MRQPQAYDLVGTMERAGYEVNPILNLIGVRTDSVVGDVYDDWLVVLTYLNAQWHSWAFPGTTDPGTYYRRHPINVSGTAILKPGNYKGAYKIGHHRGYKALQQVGDVTVYRDGNRDDVLDTEGVEEQTGIFGINIHRASAHYSKNDSPIGKWSAGCQVFQYVPHFDFVVALAEAAQKSRFDYTLLTENMFKR